MTPACSKNRIKIISGQPLSQPAQRTGRDDEKIILRNFETKFSFTNHMITTSYDGNSVTSMKCDFADAEENA